MMFEAGRTAHQDQVKMAAREMAEVHSTYYRALVDNGMKARVAVRLTCVFVAAHLQVAMSLKKG